MATLTMRKPWAFDMKHLLLLLLMIPTAVFSQKVSKTISLDGGKIIIFEQPSEVMDARLYKVEKALVCGVALARGANYEYDLYNGLQTILYEEGKYFYDGEIVRTPEGKVEIDLKGKVNGKGAYLKKDVEVINMAKKRKAIEHFLEVEVPSNIYEELISLCQMKN